MWSVSCLNDGEQERIRGRKGVSVLLVNRRAVLSPRPNVKGNTRKRGPRPPHHPRVTPLVSHPASSLSGEVHVVGRGLHGRMGRATLWAVGKLYLKKVRTSVFNMPTETVSIVFGPSSHYNPHSSSFKLRRFAFRRIHSPSRSRYQIPVSSHVIIYSVLNG